MSNSTSNLDLISASQAGKETTANSLFDAGSAAMLFGRRASTTAALTWGYYGGNLSVAGVPAAIANGTVTLTASSTNYIEVDASGVVSVNTAGFTGGRTQLYTVVTGASSVSSYTDKRLSGSSGPAGPAGAAGATGATGAAGAAGAAGAGVAIGGTAGQVLTKIDATNYNANWQTPAAGGGTSITGTTGAQGGDATATGGASSTSANPGGNVILTGGTPGATGVGGAIVITAAAGGTTSGAGGIVNITAGNSNFANLAGAVNITAGNTGNDGVGGQVTITSGNGQNASPGGNIKLVPGTGPAGRGNVVLNGTGAALATTATGGFTCIPTCAGVPTGTPASVPTGTVPMVFDSTNFNLYVYVSGAWKKTSVFA